MSRARFDEAFVLGFDLLGRLGLARPDDLAGAVREALDRCVRWIDDDDPANDPRPDVTDPRLLVVGRLVEQLAFATFSRDPLTFAWLTTECQRVWAVHGPAEPLLSGAFGLANVLIAFRADHRRACEAAQAIYTCSQTHGYGTAQSLAALTLSICDYWRNPVEASEDLAREAREGLMRVGLVQQAGFTYIAATMAALDSAGHLDAAADEVEACLVYVARTGNDYVGAENAVFRQAIRAFRGETNAPGGFADDGFDEDDFLAGVERHVTSGAYFHTYRALTAAVFGDAGALRRHSAAAMSYFPKLPGFYFVAVAHLLRALALAEQLRGTSPDDGEHDDLLAELDACREWRAAEAPANFAHLVYLVEAERAWATGDAGSAARAFDTAQHLVTTRTRPWHNALIIERAAAFHLAQGMRHAGYRLLAEARHAWQAWGPPARSANSTGFTPSFARRKPAQGRALPAATVRAGDSPASRVRHRAWRRRRKASSLVPSSEGIDLLGVLRASQALSTETNLERLRERLVTVLTAMTGATGVQLAMWNEDSADWHLPSGDGELAASMPWSAFRYAERTAEPLRVDDATADDRFARDPYLAGLDVCSLLVVPILTHGNPRAMLVLENRLARGAFSPDRLDAVLLIAGQLAVSLDNALAERFRSLVQRSTDLTLITDRNGLISYASVAATDLPGIAHTALIGQRISGLVHPDDRDDLLGLIRHADRAGSAVARQYQLTNPGGSPRWVEATVTDLTAEPAVRGVMLHLRDITERHRLETELRHAQKLESIGQLSAGIAHEINTPIQFIADNLRFLGDAFGELTTLLRPSPAPTDVDVDFLLQEIPQALADTIEGTSRVATIVHAMKALGHPGADGKAEADLNEAVRNTLIVAANEIRAVADVVTELADLPPVMCNIGDINQVLLNLVVNAAHAMADKAEQGGGGDRGT